MAHLNGNGLDNRRCNIRIATYTQNNANKRKPAGAASQYKGVFWNKGRWFATLIAYGTRHYLGRFDNELDAAAAYDKKAKKIHGEHAWINIGHIK